MHVIRKVDLTSSWDRLLLKTWIGSAEKDMKDTANRGLIIHEKQIKYPTSS